MGTGGFYAICTISTPRNGQIKYCHNLLDRRFFYGNNRVSNIFNMNDYTVKVACTTYYSASFEAKTFDEAKKLAEHSISEEFDTWAEIDNDYPSVYKIVKDYEDNLPVYEVKDYHNGVEFNDKTNKLSNIKQSVFKQDMW